MPTVSLKNQKQIESILQRTLRNKNPMALPRVRKVVINSGVGRVTKDEKAIERVTRDLALIAGQNSVLTKTKKAIANFKTRTGQIIGVKVTLRGKRMYDFISRLVNVALPRTRDFKGIDARSLDSQGNLTIGVKEHIVFPEISTEDIRNIFGFEVTISVNAKDKDQALALYRALGFPIRALSKN